MSVLCKSFPFERFERRMIGSVLFLFFCTLIGFVVFFVNSVKDLFSSSHLNLYVVIVVFALVSEFMISESSSGAALLFRIIYHLLTHRPPLSALSGYLDSHENFFMLELSSFLSVKHSFSFPPPPSHQIVFHRPC